jgi:predicted small secreted protein
VWQEICFTTLRKVANAATGRISTLENVMKALSAMLAVAMLMVFGLTIPGCNTTKGVGQDMQSGGQSIEKSADQHGATP